MVYGLIAIGAVVAMAIYMTVNLTKPQTPTIEGIDETEKAPSIKLKYPTWALIVGNSSTNPLRNTIVVGIKCLAKTLVFSIRELASNIPYTATLYVNSIATTFNAVILDGSVSFSVAVNNTPIQLHQLDLISIFLSYDGGGALSNGICATIIATPN